MIGVNTFSASTVTMVNRRPVDYDTAVEIFEKLVTDRDNTVDPTIIPEGDIYEFDKVDVAESRRLGYLRKKTKKIDFSSLDKK